MIDPRRLAGIACVSVRLGEIEYSRGTGFLVAPRKLATALHVVADLKQDPWMPYPGVIEAHFNDGTMCTVTLDRECCNSAWDFALLDLIDGNAPAEPIPLRDLRAVPGNHHFHCFGFSDVDPIAGSPYDGSITLAEHNFRGVSAIVLYSEQAAAGNGAPVKGLSGAPCLVDGYAVGIIRMAMLDDMGSTVAATLYACPIQALVSHPASGLALDVPLLFEDNLDGELSVCRPDQIRGVASHLALNHPPHLDEGEARRHVARALLLGGLDKLTGALGGLVPPIIMQTAQRMVDMAAAQFVDERHASTLRDLANNPTPGMAAVAANARFELTSRMLLARAHRKVWGWRPVCVIPNATQPEAVVAEVRAQLVLRLTEGDADELDEELTYLDQPDIEPVYVVLLYAAHRPEVVKAVCAAFQRRNLHILWFTGSSLPAKDTVGFDGIVLFEPPLCSEDEDAHRIRYERAQKRLAKQFR